MYILESLEVEKILNNQPIEIANFYKVEEAIL